MDPRRAILAPVLALVIVLAFSAVALASQPPAPGGGPAPAPPGAPAAVPASEAALITATGTVVVAPAATDFVVAPQTLFIGAQSTATSAEVDTAVVQMQQRLLAIKAALEKSGVPSAGIRFQGMNVSPAFGPPQPGQPPMEKGPPAPQRVTSFIVNASLQADVPDLKVLVAAVNAATASGATSVNVSGGGKGGPMPNTQPPADVLAKGMGEAIANARTTAQAIAAASGKKLGDIHSVSANQIFQTCCPPGSAGWSVSVVVSFRIAP